MDLDGKLRLKLSQWAGAGLADLSLYQGHEKDAIAVLTPAIAADEKTRNATGMAAKYIALAEAYAQEGRTAETATALRLPAGTVPST